MDQKTNHTRTVIILGSSRSDGNTFKVAQYVKDNIGCAIIDLKSKSIGPYDYEFKNRNDDFYPTIRTIIKDFDVLIFATPIYWYSMSGIMKNFFDRISDLLSEEKNLGRQLRGKKMAMISCGSDEEVKLGFTMPFVESANYLGMEYLGDCHTWLEEDLIPLIVKDEMNDFIKNITI